MAQWIRLHALNTGGMGSIPASRRIMWLKKKSLQNLEPIKDLYIRLVDKHIYTYKQFTWK